MAMRGMLGSARTRTIAATGAILVIGLSLTLAARALSERMLAADMQRRFGADSADISAAVGERLRTHAEVLVSMQGLYASIGGTVDRAQFRRYIDVLDLGRRYPGFQALQALRHVTPDSLDAFLAEVRGDRSVDAAGQTEFAIKPPGQRAVYDVVEFVEPMRGNEDALGFDAAANPAQLDSLRRTAETGRIVATPPVKLVQDRSGGLGFILRAPIYRAGEPAQTTSQRVAALRGFVASVYRMNDLMRGVLDPRTLQQMQVQIVDRGYAKQASDGTMSGEAEDPTAASTLMYNSTEPNVSLVSQIAEPGGVAADRALVVGERVWRLVFNARPGSIYTVDHVVPDLVLASGTVITLLIALIAGIGLRSRRLFGNLMALDAEQRALVDNPLAGILFTRGHNILRANRRIAELCGQSSDDLKDAAVESLLASDADRVVFGTTLTKIRDSAMASAAQLHLRRKDGSTVMIDAYGKPLPAGRGGEGEILWIVQDKTDVMLAETERAEHARQLQDTNARLTSSLKASEIRTKEIALLTELSGVLQSCQKPDEIFAAVETYAGFLFPDEAGALYLMNDARDGVTRGPRWGEVVSTAQSFALEDCWALRRGTKFPVSEASQGLVCGHACCEAGVGTYVCQPLIAQNTLLGVLYREAADTSFADDTDQLATMLAEQISLALANLQLREQLRSQAIRDQLTGLYNRRFLEDALARETGRAMRSGETMALLIIDVDHFKKVNDTYGHEAGDAVLRELGQVLLKTIRKTDIVGRFGGEEFLVLLPGADIDAALARANAVLDAVRAMHVDIPNGAPLQNVTASIGLSVTPLHVPKGDMLVAAADAALYQAKGQGRNRVVVSDRLSLTVQAPLAKTGTDG